MNVHQGFRKAIFSLVSSIDKYQGSLLGSLEGTYEPVVEFITSSEEIELTPTDAWMLLNSLLPIGMKKTDRAPAYGSPERAAWDAATTDNVVRYLKSLPLTYEVRAELPNVRAPHDFDLQISPSVKLCCGEEMLRRSAAPNRLFEFATGTGPIRRVSIRLRVDGYFDGVNGTSLLNKALGELKQLYFLLRYARFIKNSWAPIHSSSSWTVIDEQTEEGQGVSMPEGLARLMGRVMLADVPGSMATLLAPNPQVNPGVFPPQALVERLAPVKAFLSQPDSPDRRRLTAAMEWLVDAEISTDETIAYLAACIGLESLLGEDNQDLQTHRLADRYAWLFGKTRTMRAELNREFANAFALRGDLVHARKPKLSLRESAQLRNVQSILSKCLGRELREFVEAVMDPPG